jgi:hypothetical protein
LQAWVELVARALAARKQVVVAVVGGLGAVVVAQVSTPGAVVAVRRSSMRQHWLQARQPIPMLLTAYTTRLTRPQRRS